MMNLYFIFLKKQHILTIILIKIKKLSFFPLSLLKKKNNKNK